MRLWPQDPRSFVVVILSAITSALPVGLAILKQPISLYVKIGIIALSAIFGGTISYLEGYKKITALSQRNEQELVNVILEQLVMKYGNKLESNVTLRANVMKIDTKRVWLRQQQQKLTITYCVGDYSRDELGQMYDPQNQEGCCGIAFSRGDTWVYDSNVRTGADDNMTLKQTNATNQVNSIISVPIYSSKNQKIGVLNVDSTEDITNTKFDDPVLSTAIESQAKILEKIL